MIKEEGYDKKWQGGKDRYEEFMRSDSWILVCDRDISTTQLLYERLLASRNALRHMGKVALMNNIQKRV
jgi:hypothetical protein